MPKTKKFIDKKHAVTFHVVHRSQQDPLIADETAPQHVLLPAATERKGKVRNEQEVQKRKDEQRKYGIFFDDDYNYLQHLRSAREVITNWDLEAAPVRQDDFPPLKNQESDSSPNVKIQLPSSVFASNVEENIGLLNKAAPHTGLCLDLDPDIVAAMDDDFDFQDPDNLLEDNFMDLANVEGCSDEDSDVDSNGSNEYESEEEDDVGSLGNSECPFEKEETKSRFTSYSMSSSVIRRNNQLTLLDDRFEQLYADYDENEIGPLDSEEIEGYLAPDSDLVLQCAEEFEKQNASYVHETDKTMKLVTFMESEDETELMEVPEKTEKWDCESILSTYSNLYNHPKLITEPKRSERIRINTHTGMPLDVFGSGGNKLTARSLAKFDAATRKDTGNDCAKSIISTLSSLSIRPKNETVDQKRERKKAVKEYRKVRRAERKSNTEAFKNEKIRQEKILLNNKNNQGVKIL